MSASKRTRRVRFWFRSRLRTHSKLKSRARSSSRGFRRWHLASPWGHQSHSLMSTSPLLRGRVRTGFRAHARHSNSLRHGRSVFGLSSGNYSHSFCLCGRRESTSRSSTSHAQKGQGQRGVWSGTANFERFPSAWSCSPAPKGRPRSIRGSHSRPGRWTIDARWSERISSNHPTPLTRPLRTPLLRRPTCPPAKRRRHRLLHSPQHYPHRHRQSRCHGESRHPLQSDLPLRRQRHRLHRRSRRSSARTRSSRRRARRNRRRSRRSRAFARYSRSKYGYNISPLRTLIGVDRFAAAIGVHPAPRPWSTRARAYYPGTDGVMAWVGARSRTGRG